MTVLLKNPWGAQQELEYAGNMTRDNKTKRRVLSALLGLALLGSQALWSSVAKADGIQLAENNTSVKDIDAPTVTLSELEQARGTGLEAQNGPAPKVGNKFAVILWDEFQTPRNANSSGQSQGGGSISFSPRQ